LSFLQGANYILSLVTLLYLVRILGPSKYGLIAFAQAFIGYFSMLTNYGFNLSATREISINRENKQKVLEIFSSVITIQVIFTVLSFMIMLIIIFSFNKFIKDWELYLFTFGTVIGGALFPRWFFLGMEKMRYITFLYILSRVIFAIAIFVFIRNKSDYLYVPLISASGLIIAGIISLRVITVDFGVKFVLPGLEELKYHLKEGWHIFISTAAISLYTTSNVFILGFFANDTIVGYYSAAEKIIRAVQVLMGPVSQSIYPYISKLANESKDKALGFIRKITFLIGGTNFLISSLIFIFAPLIVNILFGAQYAQSVIVLRIIAFLPFIIALSDVFGIQTMLTFGFKKAFSNLLIIASFINIILSFILVPRYYYIGTSIVVLISEIFITVSMYIYLNKKGIKILKRHIL